MRYGPPIRSLVRERRYGAVAARFFKAAAFVVGGVIFAKWCQYGAVGALETRLGFDAASAIGVVPALALLFWVDRRFLRLRAAVPREAGR